MNFSDVSGTDARIGTLVDYKEKGAGLPKGYEQLHFFPESVQKKINPSWSRGLSEKYKEKVFVGTSSLNRTVDHKLRQYAKTVGSTIKDEQHLLKIIHDIQDIWLEAGVKIDVVRDWTMSSFSTANTIGFLKKPVPVGPSVLRREPGGLADATKPKSGLLGKAGKVLKVVAIVQGLVVLGEAAADVWRGDYRKAAGKIGSYAYDQTIGTVVDIAGGVKDAAEFLIDPFAGLKADIKKYRDEEDALLDQYFGRNEEPTPPAPPPPPAPPRPSTRKPYRGTVQQSLALWTVAVGLATLPQASPSVSQSGSTSETVDLGEINCDDIDLDELNDYVYSCADIE